MRKSVYIESSIISYLTAQPSRDVVSLARQTITLDWWQQRKGDFNVYISVAVEQEIAEGSNEAAKKRMDAVASIPVLSATAEAQELATRLVGNGSIPRNSFIDALHIAIAASYGADYLLTWNFKHINNAATKRLIQATVEDFGYTCPILCTPEELGE